MDLALIIAVIGVIAGLACIVVGLKSRRIGDSPFCRTCGYNLTRLTSERCPECGRLVAENGVVYGVRQRRPRLAVIGTIILVVCASLVADHWLNLDWTRYKPSFWLITEVQGGGLVSAQRAIKELDGRFTAGKLSPRTQSRLIDYCLKQQAANPPSPIINDLMSFLGSAYSAGALSPAQRSLMFTQAVRSEFSVRPRVVVGEQLPYKLKSHMYAPVLPTGGGLSVMIEDIESLVDNQLPTRLGGSAMCTGNHGTCIWTGRQLRTEKWPLGRHTLSVKVRLSLYSASSPVSMPDTTVVTPLHQQELTFSAPSELLASEPAGGLVRGIRDDAYKKALADCIQVRDVRFENGSVQGMIDMTRSSISRYPHPIPVAFEIIVRIGDHEVSAGNHTSSLKLTSDIHSNGFNSVGKIDFPLTQTCDVVFRGSKEVAQSTIDMYEYWDGELVFPNLPLKVPMSATSTPASSPTMSAPAGKRRADGP